MGFQNIFFIRRMEANAEQIDGGFPNIQRQIEGDVIYGGVAGNDLAQFGGTFDVFNQSL